ncbi:MAG: IPT/TIG domain-containing protein [Acidobacteria bacterium]|nr:IPT/TIG domain-containing protein [Acidobacteriota bacterium]
MRYGESVRTAGIAISLLLWWGSHPAIGQTGCALPGSNVPCITHDEFAVVEGDILVPLPSGAAKGTRTALVAQAPFAAQPWTGGVIPYAFDPGVANREAARSAMRRWEALVPVQFKERTVETNYVRIRAGSCSSSIGMAGGVQSMYADCPPGAMIHELGHILGLLHEHTRHDAGRWLDIPFARLPFNRVTSWYPMRRAADSGPYDYASIMHYPLIDDLFGHPGVTTIPRGIPTAYDAENGQPSRGDVEALHRFYGSAISVYTVATHPAGLPVLVDGIAYNSPQAFDWAAGTTHTIEAAAQTGEEAVRYTFAHWSDGGGRVHTVAATGDVTLFIANMQVHGQIGAVSEDPARGSVELAGGVIPGFVPRSGEAVLSATPNPGFKFARWVDAEGAVYGANPLRIVVMPGTPSSFRAEFTNEPITVIDSDPAGMPVTVDGIRVQTPFGAAWPAGSEHTVAALVSIESPNGYRQKFSGWSDGVLDPWRKVTSGGESARWTARYTSECRLVVTQGPLIFLRPFLPNDRTPPQVTIDPSSVDGYYPAGSTVRIRFEPKGELHFAGWDGSIVSGEPEIELRLEMPHLIGLDARLPREVWPGTIYDAASGIPWDTRPIAPGQVVKITGTGLGPASGLRAQMLQAGVLPLELGGTQVFFDGTPAPILYSSDGELLVEVPPTAPVGARVQLQVAYQGMSGAPSGPGSVAATAPAIFRAPGSPRFQALAWNEDGSENGSTQPAPPGSLLTVMVNGLGAAPASMQAVSAFAGGYRAEVVSLMMAPGLPDTVQLVAIRLPDWLEGEAHTLAVAVDGNMSASPATVAIRRPALGETGLGASAGGGKR